MSQRQSEAVQSTDRSERSRLVAELTARFAAFEDVPVFNIDAAQEAAVEIERVAEAIGEPELRMRARLLQADVAGRRGQVRKSVRMQWEVNAWAQDHDRTLLLARSHLLLGHSLRALGDTAAFLEHCVCAVELLDDSAPPRTRAFFLICLAGALARTGSMETARERYRQAIDLAVADGDLIIQRMAWNNWAYLEWEVGFPERAWAAAQRMIAVAAADGRVPDAIELDTIAAIKIALGQFAEAEQVAARALAEYGAGDAKDVRSQAEFWLTLAIAQRHLGALERAQASLDESRTLCEERELAEVLVRVQQEQAEMYAAGGDFQRAYETHKAAVAAANKLRVEIGEARAQRRQVMFETAEARQQAERFHEQARRDPLTDLYNRRFVDENLPVLIADAAGGEPLTIALVDLDRFKLINDTLSHSVGDQVLQTVGRLLDKAVAGMSSLGFVARMGGEEFLIALPDTRADDATRHLDRLREVIRSHDWEPMIGQLSLTISAGIASTEAIPGPSQAALLAEADRNLYAAKRSGRDRVVDSGKRQGYGS